MSKRVRPLRSREDRTKLAKQSRKENAEPKLDTAENINVDTKEDKLEPTIEIKETIGEVKETTQAQIVTEGLSATDDNDEIAENLEVESNDVQESQNIETAESVASIDNDNTIIDKFEPIEDTLEQEQEDLSPLAQAKQALNDNPNRQKANSSESDNKQEEKTETNIFKKNLGDDPDLVPVEPSLADDQVPNLPGAILRHARELCRISQRDVAYKLNVRVNTISDLEHDRLVQPTASKFVRTHLANYAKLVGIDPNVIVGLYDECVRKLIVQQGLNIPQKRVDKSKINSNINKNFKKTQKSNVKKYLALGGVAAVLVVGVASAIGLFTQKTTQSTGSLQIQDTVPAQVDEDGNVSMDLDNSSLKTTIVDDNNVEPNEPLKIDINTKMAQDQSESLNTNEIIARHENIVENDNTVSHETLALNSSKNDANDKAKKLQENAQKQADELALKNQVSLQSVTLNSNEKQSKVELPKAKENKPVASVNTTKTKEIPEPKVESAKNSQRPALKPGQVVKFSSVENNTNQVEKVQTQVNNQATTNSNVKLASNTRDISSSVRINNRDPLGSTNTVNISVTGDVAIKVTGSGGKVLLNGTYKSGQRVSATGIPPLKVSVSDSSKVRISYVGGNVSVPSSKQVTFTLPQR